MPQTADATLNVNGKPATVGAQPGRTLLEALREDLKLTGTKYGCGEGACGACAVLVDGKVTFSCSMPITQVIGKKITTIEGLARDDALHPAQQAFINKQSFQCGYCTAGMILATASLLEQKPQPTDAEITKAMDGHICRCCTYPRIIEAVKHAAALGRK
jgi:aerobic-type carbon monoxide dehydrogenase small subunit (CoxS/CutS family)